MDNPDNSTTSPQKQELEDNSLSQEPIGPRKVEETSSPLPKSQHDEVDFNQNAELIDGEQKHKEEKVSNETPINQMQTNETFEEKNPFNTNPDEDEKSPSEEAKEMDIPSKNQEDEQNEADLAPNVENHSNQEEENSSGRNLPPQETFEQSPRAGQVQAESSFQPEDVIVENDDTTDLQKQLEEYRKARRLREEEIDPEAEEEEKQKAEEPENLHDEEEEKGVSPIKHNEVNQSERFNRRPEGEQEEQENAEEGIWEDDDDENNIDNNNNNVNNNQNNNNNNAQGGNPEEELYRENLHNLVNNLNSLRDILQNIVLENGQNQQAGAAQQAQNNQAGGAQGNNFNDFQSQLQELRRMMQSGDANNDQMQELQQQLQGRNEQNFGHRFGQSIQNYIKKNMRSVDFYLIVLFVLGLIVTFLGYTLIPDMKHKRKDYIIDWLTVNKHSNFLIFGSSMTFMVGITKLIPMLYQKSVGEESKSIYQNILKQASKYSPFYDIGFYLLIDTQMITNRLEFAFCISILYWNLLLSKTVDIGFEKMHRIISSVTHENDSIKIKKIQYFCMIMLILNIQFGSLVVWLIWYSDIKLVIVFVLLFVLSTLHPLKVFASTWISLKNYSLVTNNNTKELSDPKFKSELTFDLVYQSVLLGALVALGFSYNRLVSGMMGIYWLSLNNAIQKFSQHWEKFQRWRSLKSKINEYFPLVDNTGKEIDDICSICHESLIIARKMPCGHVFHLKCVVYWLETQKTCPVCRRDFGNLSELFGNKNGGSTFGSMIGSIRNFAGRFFGRNRNQQNQEINDNNNNDQNNNQQQQQQQQQQPPAQNIPQNVPREAHNSDYVDSEAAFQEILRATLLESQQQQQQQQPQEERNNQENREQDIVFEDSQQQRPSNEENQDEEEKTHENMDEGSKGRFNNFWEDSNKDDKKEEYELNKKIIFEYEQSEEQPQNQEEHGHLGADYVEEKQDEPATEEQQSKPQEEEAQPEENVQVNQNEQLSDDSKFQKQEEFIIEDEPIENDAKNE